MRALTIVYLEQSDRDSEEVHELLRSEGMATQLVRVRTEQEFAEEIERPELDVILAASDGSEFTGIAALAHARAQRPDVPVVLISKTEASLGGAESLHNGASDVIPKQDLAQLVPALRRALEQSRIRGELEALRQKLREQAELLDLTHDSIVVTDGAGTINSWNRGAERIYGWTWEEAIGCKVHELLRTAPPETLAEAIAALRTKGWWEGELEQVRRDGSRVCVAGDWVLRGDGGNARQWHLHTDITPRRNAEQALRRAEERHRRFVDEDLTGNLTMRPDGSIVTCNPAFIRSFGFNSVEEALSTNFATLLHNRNERAELLAAVRKDGAVERHELEMRQPKGEAVYVAARFVGSFDPEGELTELHGYLFNDTRRKRLEQQLIQAQKMEGLGTLAGGIAHDFNNILSIILGYATQLEKRATRPEQLAIAAKVITEAVERGAALVQQLLTSARQTERRLSSVDLNELCRELEKMLQATFPKTIEFELDLQPQFPAITADGSQIHQVLLNLCLNARDAMPQGGSLRLQTLLVPSSEVGESFTGADAARYACIRVQDTGWGMTPEVKAHIFEPFFTTKERAKGTGLGLSVVYGVVHNHHGFVQVESAPDAGTTFSIYLPVEQAAEESAAGEFRPPPQPREPQTILLVEDEETLRDLGVQILQGEGYRVLAARDGIEAVDIFVAHKDSIGLVVCDLGLPRLGGRDAFLQMKAIKPSVRAIVASGYMEPAIRSEILKAGVIDTMQKPYDFRDMVEKIRSIIGKAQSEDDHPQLF